MEISRLLIWSNKFVNQHQDDSAAVLWYGKSADQNYASAQYRLAVLVDNGWGHPVDKEKAFGLYESAAERGHELAQHDTAIMYFKGSGVHKDLVQAYLDKRTGYLTFKYQ